MSFNFFGTFTTGQYECFKAFSRIQKLELQVRKAWLEKQILVIGKFTTEYEGARPVSFSANAGSYAAKLLEAYRILGGFPERDMLLRTMDQPVFLTTGTDQHVDQNATLTGGYSDIYSNGRQYRGDQRFDRELGLKVEKLKNWQKEAIKAKRERLEFKIKRALDYSDQLQAEIDIINKTISNGLGGFEDQLVDIELRARKEGTFNVVDDLNDIFGLFIGKPADYVFDDSLTQAQQGNQRGII